MTSAEAVKSGLDALRQGRWRAARPAYWWWFLFAITVAIGANMIDDPAAAPETVSGTPTAGALCCRGLSVSIV